MARTILSQYDFERMLEERVQQIKPLLKRQILLEDNEEGILKAAEQIAQRKMVLLLDKMEDKDRVINSQASELEYLRAKIGYLETLWNEIIRQIFGKEGRQTTIDFAEPHHLDSS